MHEKYQVMMWSMRALLICVEGWAVGCGQNAKGDSPQQVSTSPLLQKSQKAIGKECAAAVSFVCSEIGELSSVCKLMRESSQSLTEERCLEMLEDKAVTLRDMRQLEESRLPLSEEKRAEVEADDAPGFGPKNAKVTVVVFSDFHCMECIQMGMIVPRLRDWYPSSVRVVVRFRPSFAAYSQKAAEASMAAFAQGNFWEYYECLYNNQHDMNRPTIERCGKEVGLSMKPFIRALDKDSYLDVVKRDYALAEEVFAGKAPYFFVNGKRISPGDGERALRQAIADAFGTAN